MLSSVGSPCGSCRGWIIFKFLTFFYFAFNDGYFCELEENMLFCSLNVFIGSLHQNGHLLLFWYQFVAYEGAGSDPPAYFYHLQIEAETLHLEFLIGKYVPNTVPITEIQYLL